MGRDIQPSSCPIAVAKGHIGIGKGPFPVVVRSLYHGYIGILEGIAVGKFFRRIDLETGELPDLLHVGIALEHLRIGTCQAVAPEKICGVSRGRQHGDDCRHQNKAKHFLFRHFLTLLVGFFRQGQILVVNIFHCPVQVFRFHTIIPSLLSCCRSSPRSFSRRYLMLRTVPPYFWASSLAFIP